jgi:hypothetical protein
LPECKAPSRASAYSILIICQLKDYFQKTAPPPRYRLSSRFINKAVTAKPIQGGLMEKRTSYKVDQIRNKKEHRKTQRQKERKSIL